MMFQNESIATGIIKTPQIWSIIRKRQNMNEQIIIYESQDGETQINVQLKGETVWLSLDQIAELFQRDKSTVSRHIKNVYTEGELLRESTVANFAIVQTEGSREVERKIEHFNLDVIISVGYRVKSLRGTQFRQWANSVLKQYMLDGVAVNQKRLDQMRMVVSILGRSPDEMMSGIADVLNRFSSGLDLLDSYDHQTLSKPKGEIPEWELTYNEARSFIDSMSFGDTSDLFGVERDDSFKGIIAGLYQSFGGVELYPSIQEKAANLLYLIIKDHSFTDGNKRIAAALFVYFLEKNEALRNITGQQIINNNALAAITLMVALSAPEEKDIMCMLVMNMLSNS